MISVKIKDGDYSKFSVEFASVKPDADIKL